MIWNFKYWLYWPKCVWQRGKVELSDRSKRKNVIVCENVAVPSGGNGLRSGVRWVPSPPAARRAARDGPAGSRAGPQPWPEHGFHSFLVRTDKPGYLSAATSIQPIASRTWARFIFFFIFLFLVIDSSIEFGLYIIYYIVFWILTTCFTFQR